MTDEKKLVGTDSGSVENGEIGGQASEPTAPPEPRDPMPAIESRFMLVDIAALRAKQLRRGASPRIEDSTVVTDANDKVSTRKLERIAMAEIDRGLVVYDIPDPESKDDSEAKKVS